MELPFQWDDGTFISPFVSSSAGAIAELAAWIHDSKMLHDTHTLWITDLGCGDGSALLALSRQLFALVGDAHPLQVTAVGMDLDEELIVAAKQRADATIVPLPHRLQCKFMVGDIRHCEVERLFPVDIAATHVLFLYLLPEALEILHDKLLEASRRVSLIVSNRWDVPFLTESKIGQLQTMHLYRIGGRVDVAAAV